MPAQWIIHLTTRSGLEGGLVEAYRAELTRRGSDGVALLAPTQSAAEIARRLVLAGDQPGGLLDPRIMTFPQLAEALLVANHTSARPLTATQRELLVADILASLQDEPGLAYLRPTFDKGGTVRSLCALLDELKRGGIPSEGFHELVARSAPDHPANESVALAFTRYQDRLQELDLYDEPGLFWNALNTLCEGKRKPLEDLQVLLLDGFQEFTTTQLQMLEELGKHLERIEVRLWLDESRQRMTPRAAATRERLGTRPGATVLRDTATHATTGTNLDRLRKQVFALEPAGLETVDGTVGILEVAGGVVGECREVSRRVKLLLADRPDLPPHRVAVVLRSWDTGYDGALRQALDWYGVPVDFAQGPALLSVPAVQAALDVLDVVAGNWRRHDVIKLLNNGYVKPPGLNGQGVTVRRLERLALEAGIIGGSVGAGGPQDTWQASFAQLLHRLGNEQRRRRELESSLGIAEDDVDRERVLEDEDSNRLRSLSALTGAIGRAEQAANLVGALARLLRPLSHADSLSSAARAFGSVVHKLGIVGAARNGDPERVALDLRGLEELAEILREIAEAPDVLGIQAALDATQFASCVREACGGKRLPGTRHRHCGVQVLEASQAGLERFDTVFVCGLRDGLFPARPRQDVFYSDAVRERLREDLPGLRPRLGDQHEDEHLLHAAMVAAERQVWLSYPLTEANGSPVLPSPYVAEVLRHWALGLSSEARAELVRSRRQSEVILGLDEAGHYLEVLEALQQGAVGAEDSRLAELSGVPEELPGAGLVGDLSAKERTRREEDGPFSGVLLAPEILAELSERYGPAHIYSVSQLNLYAGCPMSFFLGRVLGLEAPVEPSEGLDRRDLGLVAHRILALFFGQRTVGRDECEPITAGNLAAARESLAGCVETVRNDPEGRAFGAPQVWARALDRLGEDLGALLEFEASENEKGPARQVRVVEATFGADGEFTPPGLEVRIRGRIDRVDLALVDGSPAWAIWDYKTGDGVAKGLVQRCKDLQLPVYAMAVEATYPGEAAGSCLWGYYRVARPVGWTTVLKRPEGGDQNLLETVMNTARETISECVAGIRAGSFPLTPDEALNPCRYCDFRGACRVG